MNLQQTTSRLKELAAEHGADLVTQTQLEFDGCCLVIYWDHVVGTGKGAIADMPKECHVYLSTDGPAGVFRFAFAFDPERYIWSIGEGLTDERAIEESRRMLEDWSEVERYLLALDYNYVKRTRKT